jgi:hypothetical protein
MNGAGEGRIAGGSGAGGSGAGEARIAGGSGAGGATIAGGVEKTSRVP